MENRVHVGMGKKSTELFDDVHNCHMLKEKCPKQSMEGYWAALQQ